MRLSPFVLALSLWIPAPADAPQPYGYAFLDRTCLWCGRDLAPDQPYFDTDACGRQWGEQIAVRGLRLHAEEIVTFGSTAPVPWAGLPAPAP